MNMASFSLQWQWWHNGLGDAGRGGEEVRRTWPARLRLRCSQGCESEIYFLYELTVIRWNKAENANNNLLDGIPARIRFTYDYMMSLAKRIRLNCNEENRYIGIFWKKIYFNLYLVDKNVIIFPKLQMRNQRRVLQNSFNGMLNAVKFENEIYFRQ